MQVTETLSQGLKRAYRVVVPAQDLAARLDQELIELKDKVRLNGFRPGKVPVGHLKRVYGRNVMADVLQNTVNEANKKIVEDNQLRLAMEPKVDFPGDQAEMEKAFEARGDLSFTVALETLPTFDVGSFEDIVLERLVTPVADEEIEKTLERMASQNRPYSPKEGKAESGDKVTIDFEGSIDGVPFDGGKGTGIDVVIGSQTFIPGFEDQLLGIEAEENRKVDVTFPENYNAPHLAGKAAAFDVTARAVQAPGDIDIDDEFAKGYGMESLEALKDAIRSNMEEELSLASRDKLKRALLDALDKKYAFELPEGLVEQEFNQIWGQVEQERQQSGKSFEDENTTEEAARADYRRIAERRVRLGLVLAAVGEKAEVQITDEEVTKALVQRARSYPGQEKAVWEYYSKNQQALAELRAPIFEDKVVDHILSQGKVTDRTVTREELFKVEEESA